MLRDQFNDCHCGRCRGGLDEGDSNVSQRRICCDACFPKVVSLSEPLTEPQSKQPRSQRKFTIKPYTTSASEGQLKQALFEWRQEAFGASLYRGNTFFGPLLLMTDIILQRIVDLAHYAKLPDVSSLAFQTKWRYTKTYGAAILEVVHQYCPQNMPTRPQRPLESDPASQTGLSQPSASTKIRQCRSCFSPFHIGKLLVYCLVY